MHRQLPLVVLVTSACLWGLVWLPLRYFEERNVDILLLLLVAYGGTTLLLSPYLWRRKERWVRQGRWLLGAALLGGFANLAFNVALVYGEIIRTMVLFYLTPVWAALGARLFLGERLDAVRSTCVLAAVGGAFLVVSGGELTLAQAPNRWDMLALLSGFTFAMNLLLFRASPSVDVVSKVGAMFAGCAVMAMLALSVFGPPVKLYGAYLFGTMVVFGAGWLFLASLGTQWAVTHMEAGRASVIIAMEVVVATISALWLANETLSVAEALGGALILGAAIIEGRRESLSTS